MTIEERLAALELSNRRYRVAVLGTLCLAVVAIGVAANNQKDPEDPVFGEVRASRFVVVDEKGRERISLDTSGKGEVQASRFVVVDEKGTERVSLDTSGKGDRYAGMWIMSKYDATLGSFYAGLDESHLILDTPRDRGPYIELVTADAQGGRVALLLNDGSAPNHPAVEISANSSRRIVVLSSPNAKAGFKGGLVHAMGGSIAA